MLRPAADRPARTHGNGLHLGHAPRPWTRPPTWVHVTSDRPVAPCCTAPHLTWCSSPVAAWWWAYNSAVPGGQSASGWQGGRGGRKVTRLGGWATRSAWPAQLPPPMRARPTLLSPASGTARSMKWLPSSSRPPLDAALLLGLVAARMGLWPRGGVVCSLQSTSPRSAPLITTSCT